jgi:WD40 repeat protein
LRLWALTPDGLPPDGLSSPTAQLRGHGRKPIEILWNPAVSNVIASSSADAVIKVWDVSEQKPVFSFEKILGDAIQSFQWNQQGNQIVVQSKGLF